MDSSMQKEVRLIAEDTVKDCFVELQNDIKDIKNAVIGNKEYGTVGIISQVKRNTDYVNASEGAKIIERAKPALKWFEKINEKSDGEKQSIKDAITEMAKVYKNLKWFSVGIISLGIINTPQAIKITLELVKGLLEKVS